MSLENLLERIAIALEELVLQQTRGIKDSGYDVKKEIAKLSSREEVQAVIDTAVKTVVEAAKPIPPVLATNPLDDEPEPAPTPPPKETTIEEVRSALKTLRDKKSQELGSTDKGKAFALKVLSEAGDGATYLPGSQQSNTGIPGQLKPANFAAVLGAAQKAGA